MNLAQAICVVTGATEGIGRAIATALANRGARLALCARTPLNVERVVRELRAHGATAVGQACDVSDPGQVRRFADFVRHELGPPDVLVNNAGIGHFVDVADMSLEQFDETFAVNVRGVFLMTKAFLPDMQRRGRGDIVNIASLAGRNAVAGAAAYAASKHAVLGFSKSLMLEVRRHGIRVIAICPGTVVTPFAGKSGLDIERPEQKLTPEDVAHAVIATLEAADRAMISELDIRPSNP
ncbi:MAG TPA: SDR family NAD(P)-dependent oxidoreductase [Gemmatimonadales bacterium]|nr:SDR family NAD(P)-dependent oxidoreductase [Gemmatimonadales bacterium]